MRPRRLETMHEQGSSPRLNRKTCGQSKNACSLLGSDRIRQGSHVGFQAERPEPCCDRRLRTWIRHPHSTGQVLAEAKANRPAHADLAVLRCVVEKLRNSMS